MLVIDYIHKDTVIKVEELPRYTLITFISDVGGILGIFLGLSFWSLYGFIAPVIQKLTIRTKKKAQTSPVNVNSGPSTKF